MGKMIYSLLWVMQDLYHHSSRRGDNIGALIIRIGFWGFLIIFIV